jgi:RNA polymerase sigma factor (sigma-70 family)
VSHFIVVDRSLFMTTRDDLALEFEACRPHLRSVGYRMLGSLSEADDAVQECWMRLDRREGDAIIDLRAWLTVVVGRICLDMLRARKSRREEYLGTWLPEPLVHAHDDPERDAFAADSVGLALLVVLEELTPAERLAFVLHDVFAVPFEEVGTVLDRSPAAARQLASRARKRVQGMAPPVDADLAVQRRVVDAFLAAARAGDFNALVAVLDDDVVFRGDLGPHTSLPPVRGRREVAEYLLSQAPRFAHLARPVLVNGMAGIAAFSEGTLFAATGFTISNGRIVEIDLVADPRKLGHLQIADDTEE